MGVTPFMSSTIQDLFEEITNGKGHVIITWPIVTWQQLRVYYYFKVLDFWSLHLPLSLSPSLQKTLQYHSPKKMKYLKMLKISSISWCVLTQCIVLAPPQGKAWPV